MKGYTSENIRNVALLGHGGCGKTTFLEAALLATGVISRMGKVEDGNTVSDYDKSFCILQVQPTGWEPLRMAPQFATLIRKK